MTLISGDVQTVTTGRLRSNCVLLLFVDQSDASATHDAHIESCARRPFASILGCEDSYSCGKYPARDRRRVLPVRFRGISESAVNSEHDRQFQDPIGWLIVQNFIFDCSFAAI